MEGFNRLGCPVQPDEAGQNRRGGTQQAGEGRMTERDEDRYHKERADAERARAAEAASDVAAQAHLRLAELHAQRAGMPGEQSESER